MNRLLIFDREITAVRPGFWAGIDEAGRGPLAGPVVAACVILPLDGEPIDGVNDSKQVSAKKREKLYDQILSQAVAVGVGVVDNKRIDEINILNATRQAMEEAYGAMGHTAEGVLVDSVKGLNIDSLLYPYDHGDELSYSIAAASIVAKVYRDRLMMKVEEEYPGYGFAQHKGYGTAQHIRALETLGPCAIHRRSFIKHFALGGADGKYGEDWAAAYLKARGFQLLQRNYRGGAGEIDIIAQREDLLAFIEVKTRHANARDAGVVAVDGGKQRRIVSAAAQYISQNELSHCQVRFDVMEIYVDHKGHLINYLSDAFEAEENKYVV